MARKKGTTLTADQRVRSKPGTCTPAKLAKYLQLHGDGIPSNEAARKAGVTLTTVSRRKVSDPEFKAAHKAAAESFTDHLEAMAEQGAMSPMRYGPTLLIFLLKARRPDVYRENAVLRVPELTGFVGAFTSAMERLTSGG